MQCDFFKNFIVWYCIWTKTNNRNVHKHELVMDREIQIENEDRYTGTEPSIIMKYRLSLKKTMCMFPLFGDRQFSHYFWQQSPREPKGILGYWVINGK